jgi:hypothetical protein
MSEEPVEFVDMENLVLQLFYEFGLDRDESNEKILDFFQGYNKGVRDTVKTMIAEGLCGSCIAKTQKGKNNDAIG